MKNGKKSSVMKKAAAIAALMLVVGSAGVAAEVVNGSPANGIIASANLPEGAFEIRSDENLREFLMSEDKEAYLVNDITITGSLKDGKGNHLSLVSGKSIYGCGYTVNIKGDQTDSLFEKIEKGATIRNTKICFKNTDTDSKIGSGVLCKENYGNIEYVTATAYITSENENTGIICGVNHGKIFGCIAEGKVICRKEESESEKLGGICGSNYGTIERCSCSAEVQYYYYYWDWDWLHWIAASNIAGGFCGYSDGTITDCVFDGKLTEINENNSKFPHFNEDNSKSSHVNNENVGGLCGRLANNGKIENCFYYCTDKTKKSNERYNCLGSEDESISFKNCYRIDSDGKNAHYHDDHYDDPGVIGNYEHNYKNGIVVRVLNAGPDKTRKEIVWKQGEGNRNYPMLNMQMDTIEYEAPVALDNLVYNGEEQTLVKSGVLLRGCGEFQYSFKKKSSEKWSEWSTELPKAEDAGEYEVKFKIDSKADSYSSVGESGPISVTVKKRAVVITAEDKTSKYGEDPAELTYASDGFIKGEEVKSKDVKLSCEVTAASSAGTYDITAEVKSENYPNYVIKTNNGKYTVTKAESYCEAPKANELTYNGTAQKLVTAGTAEGGTLEYSLDEENFSAEIPTGKGAGIYTVYYRVTGDENHNSTAISKITVTIAKKEATVTANSATSIYGEDPAELTYASDGFIKGEEVKSKDVKLSCEVTAASSAGTYDITAEVKSENYPNYVIKTNNGKYTVTKAESYCEAPKANELTYNGTAQKLVTAGTAEGGTLEYSLDEENFSAEIPTGKGAGIYTVYYRVTGDENHNSTAISKITVTIAKKEATVTANSATSIYGEDPAELTYASDGFVNGEEVKSEDVKLSCEVTSASSAGTYDIKVTVESENYPNYEIKTNDGKYTVTKAESSCEAPKANELTYNGTEQELVTAGTA